MLAQAARWAALAGGVGLFLIVVLTCLNALGFALDRALGPLGLRVGGLPGYEEAVSLIAAASVPLFLPWCQACRGHVRADVAGRLLGTRTARLLDRMGLVLMAGLALFLAWMAGLGAVEARADGAVGRILGWPHWPFYLPAAGAFALSAVIAAAGLRDG